MANDRCRNKHRTVQGLSPATVSRILRTAPRTSVPAMYLLGAMMNTLAPEALAAKAPNLPTPCAGAPCGMNKNNLAFVEAGQIGNGGLPSVAGNAMTVNQLSKTAILNWQDFNIASGYSVKFAQPGTTSEVLNRIWSADPSVISGALSANGQVYLVNQNGIVFGGGAQVNVGSLTASSLDVTDTLFQNGILSGNKSVVTGSGAQTLSAAFQADAGQTTIGGIVVNPGATLTAADGGRIMLLGSKVVNQGNISTPDGQTLLGAGDQVYLAASNNPSLRGLLIEVNASALAGSGSGVTNQGTITADRGNVTLAGLLVNQAGTITATSSVAANGSIYLVAGDTSGASGTFYETTSSNQGGFGAMLPNNGGTLTLAPGSITTVLPDTTSTATITNANQSQFITSQVGLVGKIIDVQGNASVIAPGADVALSGASDPFTTFTVGATPAVGSDGSRIYLDSGSTIDVSGLTNVDVPVTNNIVQVTLESIDLQNDPLLRNSFLHGATVVVNADQGSTLFNTAPYLGNVTNTIEQELSVGGKIQLNSAGDVITRSGSTLNVSGGSIAYQGGYADAITTLLGTNGKIYSIQDAPNNISYSGLANTYSYTDPTWGVKTFFAPMSYYAGYTQGASAGSLQVEAPQVYLRGSMLANTTVGPYQRNPGSLPGDLPQGGTFTLGNPTVANEPQPNLQAPSVIFLDGAADDLPAGFNPLDPSGSPLPTNFADITTLSPTLLGSGGFNNLSINSNGSVSLPAGEALNLAGNGSFTVHAQSIEIDGSVTSPGGAISLSAELTAVPENSSFAYGVTLGSGATLDVAGGWVNDSPQLSTQEPTAPIFLNGGSVSINAYDNVSLGANSLIDVSGGAWVNTKNAVSDGSAGSIALHAGKGRTQGGATPFDYQVVLGGSLLGASLAPGKGGSLSIESGSVTVGNKAFGSSGELLLSPGFFSQGGFKSYSITGDADVIIGQDSSSTSNPSGAGPTAAVTVYPVEDNLVLNGNFLLQPTGTALSSFTTLEELPNWQRAPASISFASSSGVAPTTAGSTCACAANEGVDDGYGNVTLNAGSNIFTDPGGNVALSVNGYGGNLGVYGAIVAPGGNISLTLGPSLSSVAAQNGSDIGYIATQALTIGPQAVLAAPAQAQIFTNNPENDPEGSILPGGVISLQANKGYVDIQQGSTIDVAGAEGTIDVQGAAGLFTPTVIAGNAGTIAIDAREGIVLLGTLLGQAAPVSGAEGGTLSIGLDLFNYSGTSAYNLGGISNPYPTGARTLTISNQSVASIASGLTNSNGSINLVDGTAVIAESELNTVKGANGTVQSGGFDNVVLKSTDVISFQSVTLDPKASLVLDAPVLQGQDGTAATLISSYVAIGNYFANGPAGQGTQESVNPFASGTLTPDTLDSNPAELTVSAQLIDIRGSSELDNIANATLESTGDIRLTGSNVINSTAPYATGSLYTAGSLDLQAAQVYPTTATTFWINAAANPSQSVTIEPGNGTASPAMPLSAGGALQIVAGNIVQDGILRAPLGQITLDAAAPDSSGNSVQGNVTLGPSSVTSVSAAGELIPYGATVNGLQLVYSYISTTSQVVTAPPAKQVSIDGANVTVDNGAKLDLSGGGDLYAYEWIAGPGGSSDVLAAGTGTYTYAVLPTLGSSYAPLDYQYDFNTGFVPGFSSPLGGTPVGSSIYLAGVPGLAAGNYALLPARYALLPGAYAIQVVQSDSNLLMGTAAQQIDGSYITAARFGIAGTDVLSSQTSTIKLVPDAVVRTQSQYNDSYGDTFFSSAAATAGTAVPPLPADAGALAFNTSNSLSVGSGAVVFGTGSYTETNSSGKTVTVQGQGGTVEISAPSIALDSGTGAVELSVAELNGLAAQTLILGATATTTSSGEALTVGASSITLNNSSADPLSAPQIILAATGSITLGAGSQLAASGTLNSPAQTLTVSGDGALLQVSAGAASQLVRSDLPANPVGYLQIGANASVSASGSLLLDSSASPAGGGPIVDPTATIAAPAVTLESSRISMGDVNAATTPGLDLTSQLLSTLTGTSLTSLTLSSGSTIDFYGPVTLGNLTKGAPQLQSITLESGGLNGYDAGGQGNVTLNAGAVTLDNSAGVSGTALNTPAGTGSLVINAIAGSQAGSGQITLGGGATAVNGFGELDLVAAGGAIVGQGSGSLSFTPTAGAGASAALNLESALLSTGSGATQSITNTGGAVNISFTGAPAGTTAPALPLPGYGGSLSVNGTAINQSGTINLPAGIIALNAGSGDVVLGGGSVTSAAGASEAFFDTYGVAAGGRITLAAAQGNVSIQSGATVDVAGATSKSGNISSGAGSLSISAPQGQFTLDTGATLQGGAASGQLAGNFSLDVGNIQASSDISTLNSALNADGFAGNVAERVRGYSGELNTGSINASSYELAVDQGSILVDGTINTGGGNALSSDGGAISLWAGANLTVAANAVLDANSGLAGATARAARGGDITLSAGGLGAGTGSISLGGTIELAGDLPGQAVGAGEAAAYGGTLTLITPRTGYGTANVGVAIGAVNAQISGSQLVVVEGSQTYQGTSLYNSTLDSNGNLDISTSGQMYTDAQAFAANAGNIYTGLFGANGTSLNVEVRPGVIVESSQPGQAASTLTLNDSWDLSQWHFNETLSSGGQTVTVSTPIDLTLRATGDLVFNASLSDGFQGTAPNATFGGVGDSATYRLAAGADLTSADPLAVVAGGGNFILAASSSNPTGNLIRTGDGNISLAAGGNVQLGYDASNTANPYGDASAQASVIYTAGIPSATLANFPLPSGTRGSKIAPAYPDDGGNISVVADGSIVAAPSNQIVSNWMWRRGATSNGDIVNNENTTWWINFAQFQQGVGALGGGDVSIQAGGDITNLSVVIPSTGRLAGAANTAAASGQLVVDGGGDLQISAGGNIGSGVFEADWGNAAISAQGAIDSSTSINTTSGSLPVYPILVYGYQSGSYSLAARTGLDIETALNSTAIPEYTVNQTSLGVTSGTSYFYTYSANNTLNLTSTSGSLALDNNTNIFSALFAAANDDSTGVPQVQPTQFLIYPASLNATALSGSIQTNGAVTPTFQFPAATGNLNLLASGDIGTSVIMYENDPTQLPGAYAPANTLLGIEISPSTTAAFTAFPLPVQPLHQGDSVPARIISDGGDITLTNTTLPKAAEIVAGGDIVDPTYAGKNMSPSDVTLFEAGGTITLGTPTNSQNDLLPNSNGIKIGGPGSLEVLAGGTVDLGDGVGVISTGNIEDNRLPSGGATLVVAAGLGQNADGSMRQPDLQAFINNYIAPDQAGNPGPYANDLISYMEQFDGGTTLSYSTAYAQFQTLTPQQQLPLVAQAFYDELSATGIAHNKTGANYQTGFTAISTLFPTKDSAGNALSYAGNIDMFFSQIKTEQGGNIDLLAPGGSVVVGLPNPPAALNAIKETGAPPVPAAAELGVLALGTGAIQGFAENSFEVNQSRILTLEGGNIILWASQGSIDAGAGAKSASGAPPPVLETDAQGNVFLDPINDVSGSGIGQLIVTPGVTAGLVNLIAPNGAVNAGDAGIRVAGNLNIAAVIVIGANNITVAGTSAGVPVSQAGALSGALTGASALGDSSKNVVQQLTQNLTQTAAVAQQLAESLAPSFVVVKLFCLGTACEVQ